MTFRFWFRFWARVEKTQGCWNWLGAPTKGMRKGDGGYGRYHSRYAHRLVYEMTIGPIPSGHEIDHLCRNRMCVNPKHLEAVVPKVNNLRSLSFVGINSRKTHCPQGHPYSGRNLIVRRNHRQTNRICRTCERTRLSKSGH